MRIQPLSGFSIEQNAHHRKTRTNLIDRNGVGLPALPAHAGGHDRRKTLPGITSRLFFEHVDSYIDAERACLWNDLQEEADVGVAAVLTCYRGLRLQAANVEKDNGELFEEAVALIQKKKFEQQKAYVQEQVAAQLETAFEAILKTPSVLDANSPKISLSGFERLDEAADKQNPEHTLEKLLGYSLKVETSSIANAGEGVKLNGKVPIGSLVALFPGTVYLPEHFKKPQYLKEISDNPYARARFDSVVIDAKRESSTPRNPLAVAHKINHPPPGSKPNVIPFSFDFPPEEPFTQPEHQKLIPNSFVEMPSRWSMFGKRALVHGLTFIATADIEDEELFLNYRYNPNNPLPDWYAPVDLESDRDMWK